MLAKNKKKIAKIKSFFTKNRYMGNHPKAKRVTMVAFLFVVNVFVLWNVSINVPKIEIRFSTGEMVFEQKAQASFQREEREEPKKEMTVEEKVRDAFGENSDKALAVFSCESGLDPKKHSGVDVMSDGRTFSVGVAQINLTVSKVASVDCSKAFSGRNKYAKVVDEKLYSQCVKLAEDVDNNLAVAKEKYSGRGNFTAWLYCDRKTK